MSTNATTTSGPERRGGARRPAAVLAIAAAAVAAAGAAGCEATIHPAALMEPAWAPSDLFLRARTVPSDIWAYPHVSYGASYAYLVDGVWYYPTPDGWMIFRQEPIELSRERTRIGGGRMRTPGQGYPPSSVPPYPGTPYPPSTPYQGYPYR